MKYLIGGLVGLLVVAVGLSPAWLMAAPAPVPTVVAAVRWPGPTVTPLPATPTPRPTYTRYPQPTVHVEIVLTPRPTRIPTEPAWLPTQVPARP